MKLRSFLGIVTVFLVWELYARSPLIDRILFPAISDVALSLMENVGYLFFHLSITIGESVLSFLIAFVLSVTMAILFFLLKPLKDSFLPLAIALNATPIIALAPIIILWFGNGEASKIVLGVLVCFFPILINTMLGLDSVSHRKKDLLVSYKASVLQQLLRLQLPTALPFLFSGLKVAASFSVVGVVIAEYLASTKGLGHVIVTSSYYLDVPLMFAAIFLLSLWGVCFYFLVSVLEYYAVKKKKLIKYF